MLATSYPNGTYQDTPQSAGRDDQRPITWDDLPLTAHDIEVCRVRGITPEIAHAYQLRSWTAAEAAANGYRGNHARSGMAIPNYNLAGELDDYQLRPHNPAGDRKYLWRAGHTPAIGGMPAGTAEAAEYADRLRHDLSVPVIVTESTLKNGSMLSQAKRPIYTVSIHGNWNWSVNGALSPDVNPRLLPLRRKRGGKVVQRRLMVLFPDSDYWTKPEVMRGWWEYGNAVRQAYKADVRVARVPNGPNGEKWGPDDAVAAGAVTVEDLIDTATPLPDILPAPTTRQDDDASLSEIERLRRRVAQLEADNAALIALILNPHIKPTDKIAMVSAGTKVQAMAAKGEIKPLESAEIANDYRAAKRPKGTPKPTTNPSGTMPIMERAAVKSALERAKELGWMEVKSVPHTITRSNGTSYTDTAWMFEPAPTLGAFIMPAATYVPKAVKERKAYTRQKPCPHCNQVHDRVQVTYCGGYSADGEIIDGCQGEISRRVIRKPMPQREEITPEQREHLDNITRDENQPIPADTMSGKNPDIVSEAPINTSSPDPRINCPEKITTCSPDDEPAPSVLVCSVCEMPRSADNRPCPSCSAVGRKWITPPTSPPEQWHAQPLEVPA